MKTPASAAALVMSLAVALAGTAQAAGQPQLPNSGEGLSAQERMDTKTALDADKYEKPQSMALHHRQAAPSQKQMAHAKTEAVHRGAVGKTPTPGPESTGTAQASPSPAPAPLATPGAVEAGH